MCFAVVRVCGALYLHCRAAGGLHTEGKILSLDLFDVRQLPSVVTEESLVSGGLLVQGE